MELAEFCALMTIDPAHVDLVDVDRLQARETQDQLAANRYAILHDVIDREAVARMRETWFRELHRRDQLAFDVTLGEPNYSHSFFGRYHRCFEFYWNEPTDRLSRDVSLLIHYARNIVTGFHPMVGLSFVPDRTGVYLAITHYAAGHGEMALHRDPNEFLPTHFILPLTHKGRDYGDGGLTLHLDSGPFNVDGALDRGSLLLFTGSIPHSVARVNGAGTETSAGRLQMFSIPTRFTQARPYSAFRNVVTEVYGRLKYLLYQRGIGFRADQRNFR